MYTVHAASTKTDLPANVSRLVRKLPSYARNIGVARVTLVQTSPFEWLYFEWLDRSSQQTKDRCGNTSLRSGFTGEEGLSPTLSHSLLTSLLV